MLRRPAHGRFWFTNESVKLLLILNPKVASTSTRTMLNLKRFIDCEIDINTYHKFAILRDPVTRVVSSYSEVLKLRNDGVMKAHLITPTLPFYNIKDPIARFTQFVDDIEDNLYDEHLLTQSFYMDDTPIDTYVKFESLMSGLQSMVRDNKLNIPINNSILNRSKINNQQLVNHIRNTPALESKIMKIYEADYEILNSVFK